jgi:uncharacterized protein YqjF (DUF2071 family)
MFGTIGSSPDRRANAQVSGRARTVCSTYMTLPSESARVRARERPVGKNPVMFQKWRDLLFLHWEYDVGAIQRTLPDGLYVDTFDGKAYLGIVPFFMKDVRPRFTPSVPGISDFQELNFRTYVHDEKGVPGIWFYSLDANQCLAVNAAKMFFHLPYFYATMKSDVTKEKSVSYRSCRAGSPRSLETCFTYRSVVNTRQAQVGTLEFFLIERYVLFAHADRK